MATSNVPASEERDDGEAMHRLRQVLTDQGAETVRLAVVAEFGAFELLEVFQLDLEELDHLESQACGAGDADDRGRVGTEHLLDVVQRDVVAHGCPTVPSHQDAVGIAGGHDCGAMR